MLTPPITVSFSRPAFAALALMVNDHVYRSMAELVTHAVIDWLQNLHPSTLPDPLPFIPAPQPRGRKVSLTSTPQAAVRLPSWQLEALAAARPESRLVPLLREVVETWLDNAQPEYKRRGEASVGTTNSRTPTPASADPLTARVATLEALEIRHAAEMAALVKRIESLERF